MRLQGTRAFGVSFLSRAFTMYTASKGEVTAGPYSRIDLEDDSKLWDYGGTRPIALPSVASAALPLLPGGPVRTQGVSVNTFRS